MLITKSKLSSVAGVSRAAISRMTSKGGKLHDAVCAGKIDTSSESVRIYLRKHGVDLDKFTSKVDEKETIISNENSVVENKSEAINNNFEVPKADVDIVSFENMTLPQLCEVFGTDERFKIWVTARKMLTDVRKNELANAATEGKLVSRDLVKIGIIDPLDAVHTKLLTDGAKTIARRAVAMNGAGKGLDEIEKFVKDQITSFIRPVKSKVAKALKNA